MEVIKSRGWVYYIANNCKLDTNKVGKCMCFFDKSKNMASICEYVTSQDVVNQSKHSDANEGVACFYLNCDDVIAHKKIILYLIENSLIGRTKNGRLYNISFKLDKQTLSGVYADKFKSEIKLSNYVDLATGKWLL